MNTKRITIVPAVIALVLLVFPALAPADVGPNATVKRDNVEAHEAMSLKSDVVEVLQKGKKLIVVSEEDNAEGGWCLIREPQETKTIGYVLCRYLAEEGGTVEEVEQAEEVKRPYSDVRVLLYMTEGCAYSRKALELLQGLGVDLVVYDVVKNPEKGREMYNISGKKSVPFIDIEGVHITGYYEKAIKDAVEKAR